MWNKVFEQDRGLLISLFSENKTTKQINKNFQKYLEFKIPNYSSWHMRGHCDVSLSHETKPEQTADCCAGKGPSLNVACVAWSPWFCPLGPKAERGEQPLPVLSHVTGGTKAKAQWTHLHFAKWAAITCTLEYENEGFGTLCFAASPF